MQAFQGRGAGKSNADAQPGKAKPHGDAAPQTNLVWHQLATLTSTPAPAIMRKCACGGTTGEGEECEDCRSKNIHPKLRVSQPGDAAESEADRMADRALRLADPSPPGGMPAAAILRQADGDTEVPDEKEEPETDAVFTLDDNEKPAPEPATVLRRAAGSQPRAQRRPLEQELAARGPTGSPLPGGIRAFFEPRFQSNFEDVRIHTDSGAAHLSQRLNALAFTYNRDIFFAGGQYAPGSDSGRRLLAHELAHVVQRGSPGIYRQGGKPKPAPTLPPDVPFLWQVRGVTMTVTVRKDWVLKKGVAPEDTEISGQEVIEPLIQDLAKQATWINVADVLETKPRIQCGKAVKDLADIFQAQITRGLLAAIGTPPGQDIVWQVKKDGLTAWVSKAYLIGIIKNQDDTTIRNEGFTRPFLESLEKFTGLKLMSDDAEARETFIGGFGIDLRAKIRDLPRAIPIDLTGDELAKDFGQEKWTAFQKSPESKDAPGSIFGQAIHLPEESAAQWPQIREILQQVLGPPDPKASATPKDIYISRHAAELLVQIATSKDKDAILALLRPSGKVSDGGESLENLLEKTLAEQRYADALKRLEIESTAGAGAEQPLEDRPVHGQIVNRGGRLIPGKPAQFFFEVQDDLVSWRMPFIHIQWVAYPKGKPERTNWIGEEKASYSPWWSHGIVNDILFDVTFAAVGEYVVEALVNHNYFLPNQFRQFVSVITEAELTKELEKTALGGFAAGTPTEAKHAFDVGLLSNVTKYEEGTRTTGQVDPAFKGKTVDERLKAIDDEISNVSTLVEGPNSSLTAGDVKEYANAYLKRLRERRKVIKDEAIGQSVTVLPCQGVYASRSKNVPSGTLSLLCHFTRSATGDYTLVLHDFTQLYEREDYRVETKAGTLEKASEDIFVQHGKNYPNGTMTMAFQQWDETAQTFKSEYLKFTKVTDTVAKDIKNIVFSPVVDITVNLISVLLMAFPPTALLGLTIGIAYNTSKTVTELVDKADKGTLTAGGVALGIGSIALDIIPLAGKAKRIVQLGRKAFIVMEGVSWLGQGVMMTTEGLKEVEHLRDGEVASLAKIQAQITEIERVNLSDPELPRLRRERDDAINSLRTTSIKVFTELAGKGAIMMVGAKLVHELGNKTITPYLEGLKSKGKFKAGTGEPHYNAQERAIVGDESQASAASLLEGERASVHDERLSKAIPDADQRQKVIDALGATDVEIAVGGTKTGLDTKGDRPVLRIGSNATPEEILAAAKSAAATVPNMHAEEPPAGPPPPPAAGEVKLRKEVKKKTVDGGHDVTVTKAGEIWRCSDPCLMLREEYLAELAENPKANKELQDLEEMAKGPGSDADSVAGLAKDLEAKLAKQRHDNLQGKYDDLVKAKTQLETEAADVAALLTRSENRVKALTEKRITIQGDDKRAAAKRGIDEEIATQKKLEAEKIIADKKLRQKVQEMQGASPDAIERSAGYQYDQIGTVVACFPAGTLVRTRTGLCPIESLEAGDSVESYDEETGSVISQPVVRLHHSRTEALVRLRIGPTAILATRLHRFWEARARDWLPACELQTGALLRTAAAGICRVDSVSIEPAACPTYNLEVFRAHNYFVSEAGVLVHNEGGEWSYANREPKNFIIYKVFLTEDPSKIIYVGQTYRTMQERLVEHARNEKRVMPDGRAWADLMAQGKLKIEALARGYWSNMGATVQEKHWYVKKEAEGHPLQNNDKVFITATTFRENRKGQLMCP